MSDTWNTLIGLITMPSPLELTVLLLGWLIATTLLVLAALRRR